MFINVSVGQPTFFVPARVLGIPFIQILAITRVELSVYRSLCLSPVAYP